MSRVINLENQTFGHLLVLKRVENTKDGKAQWLCQCDCGNQRIVIGKNLRNGQTKACLACSKKLINFKDLSGLKFGRLTCLEPTDQRRGSSVVWKCKCECGTECYKPSKDLLDGKTKSCGCLQEESRHNAKIKLNKGERFGKLTVIEQTSESNDEGILWKCKCDCGGYKLASSYSLRIGRVNSCGCLNSVMNSKIANILKELNINFYSEYRFKDCKDIRPLSFDFYLPDYNLCIEYDGEQHNKIIKYWGDSDGLKDRQKKDNIKNDFCKKNNIKLIRISYLEKDKIDSAYIEKILTDIKEKING